MPDTAPYSWDATALRFRNSAGKFVANESVKGAVKSYSDAIAGRIRGETAKFNSGGIKLDTYRRNVQGLIKQSATASAIIAVGGVERFDQKARDRAQREVKFQYGHFNGLLKEVKAGTISGDALASRAAMYAGTATRSYEAVRRVVNGVYYREERRRLGNSSKHCSPCIGHASTGWVPVGTLADIGDECDCLSNCNCYFEYRFRRSEGEPPAEIKEPELASEPSLPEFGPSQAAISHAGYSPAVARQSVRSLFGPKATLQDLASAVGAPDDAKVEVVPDFEKASVTFSGPGYTASRTVRREIISGKLVIDNESFYVDPKSQGKGIGANVFGRQVEQASRLKVDSIKTFASGNRNQGSDIGYKIWGRFGYDGIIHKELIDGSNEGIIDQLPHQERSISDLMKTREGRQWWDHNGYSIDLQFDLSEGSLSRQVWDGYRQEKIDRENARK